MMLIYSLPLSPAEDMTNKAKEKKITPKRLETQARMIRAFETVLLRDGIQDMGVNAVLQEAGVGKGLLYDYFGGLGGLADAWVEQSHFIPEQEEIAGEPLDSFVDRPLTEQISAVHINYASYLRDSKVAKQLMTEELLAPSHITESLAHIRNRIGETHEAFFTKNPDFGDPDMVALIFILQAASNYFAMRAQTTPKFNGVDLDTEEGWKTVMDMIDRVAKKFDH
ncbi:MAG: TetR/AcrR family transcriptional regulator [Pseudomonadales bacterium]